MTPRPLSVRAYRHEDSCTLVLSGELDLSGAELLPRAVGRLCGEGARELVLDFTDVDFIDSTGLRAILMAKALCAEHLCDFCVTHGRGQVGRLFELTRVLDPLRHRRPPQAPRGTPIELWPQDG